MEHTATCIYVRVDQRTITCHQLTHFATPTDDDTRRLRRIRRDSDNGRYSGSGHDDNDTVNLDDSGCIRLTQSNSRAVLSLVSSCRSLTTLAVHLPNGLDRDNDLDDPDNMHISDYIPDILRASPPLQQLTIHGIWMNPLLPLDLIDIIKR